MNIFTIPFEFSVQHSLDEVERRFRHKADLAPFDWLRSIHIERHQNQIGFVFGSGHPILPFTMNRVHGEMTAAGPHKTGISGRMTPHVSNAMHFVVMPVLVAVGVIFGLLNERLDILAISVVFGLLSVRGIVGRWSHGALGVEHYFNRILHQS